MANVSRVPRILVGLPVYNGEAYLRESIDSILGQTCGDFILFIADNASTDGTPAICQAYVARDSRVRYHRHPVNIGAIQNWYYTFNAHRAEYFLGATHDDLLCPEFLRRCVDVLDRQPDAVVAYSRAHIIDAAGALVGDFPGGADTWSPAPHVRLLNVLRRDLLCLQLLGLMRSSAFAQVTHYAGYYGCDRNVLVDLALRGGLYEVPEYLFKRRLHAGALGAAASAGHSLSTLQKWDPGTNWSASWPAATRMLHYVTAVAGAPIPVTERLRCLAQLPRLVIEKRAARRVWQPASQ